MRPIDIPQIAELSKPEKILFVEDLWDDIATDESGIPIPDSHRKELDRRLQAHKKSPGNLLTLEELIVNIEKRK